MAGRSNSNQGIDLLSVILLQASSRDSGGSLEGRMHCGAGWIGKLVHPLHYHLGGVSDPEVCLSFFLSTVFPVMHTPSKKENMFVLFFKTQSSYQNLRYSREMKSQTLFLHTRYEAASTIYGPHTLLAYQQQYARIVKVTSLHILDSSLL